MHSNHSKQFMKSSG